MDQILVYILLAVLGLMMGSFAGATVWRLRATQLKDDKTAGESVDEKEYKTLSPLVGKSFSDDRSRCLHCGHVLAWYDLFPLVSWLSTAGKCRYCHKKIGWFEPLMEIGTALLFVGSYFLWPQPLSDPAAVLHFSLWLVACVMLVVLFAYDLRWYLLPNRIVFPLIAVALVMATLSLFKVHDLAGALLNLSLAVAILSGLYFVIWIASKGAWVGFGDVKLGLGLALLLGQWQLAFLALFAANLIGIVVVLPGMFSGKMSRKTRVPFGPLLILGAIISMIWGTSIVQWYFLTFA